MKMSFTNKEITGISLVLPSEERFFLEDMKNFNANEKRSLKLKEIMGYDKHRIAPANITGSDMVVWGMNQLFEDGLLNKDEIDAIVYVTATPDHFLPPTSRIIHGKLGLEERVYCIDITQGCCAFVEGLIQSFLLLDQQNINTVVLITADVLSHKVSVKDRNSYPLIGDAASITVVKKSEHNNKIEAVIKNDGTRAMALQIPAGGFRLPHSAETSKLTVDAEGNERSLDNLVMDGTAVFNFVMQDVPPMLVELISDYGITKDNIDYYLFHQPNKFMLNKLAEKLEVPYEKMPANVVENYGNSSGTTIPAIITLTLDSRPITKSLKICFSGFGVGLTWGAIIMDLYKLDFCKTYIM